MYFFGGNDIRMGTMNNLWSLELDSIGDLKDRSSRNAMSLDGSNFEWKSVRCHGSIPGPLSHHQSVICGKNMYLIGGCITGKDYNQSQMYRLDLQTFNWD